MDRKQENLKKLRVFGYLAAAAGIGLIFLGLREAGYDNARYIGFQAVGAVLLLLGITPAIRYRQQYGAGSGAEQNPYSSGREQIQEEDTSWIPVGGWIFADVIGITRNLRTDASSGVEYYVICRYRDFKEHVEHTFTSRSMKEYRQACKGILSFQRSGRLYG